MTLSLGLIGDRKVTYWQLAVVSGGFLMLVMMKKMRIGKGRVV